MGRWTADDGTYWECDFCGDEFSTADEHGLHLQTCRVRLDRNGRIVSYLVIAVVVAGFVMAVLARTWLAPHVPRPDPRITCRNGNDEWYGRQFDSGEAALLVCFDEDKNKQNFRRH